VLHSSSNVCITELGPVWTAFHEAVIKIWVKLMVKCYILSFHQFVKQFMVLAQWLYFSKITSPPYWGINDHDSSRVATEMSNITAIVI